MCKICENKGWELSFINNDWEWEFCRCGIEPKAIVQTIAVGEK